MKHPNSDQSCFSQSRNTNGLDIGKSMGSWIKDKNQGLSKWKDDEFRLEVGLDDEIINPITCNTKSKIVFSYFPLTGLLVRSDGGFVRVKVQ